MYLYMGQKGSWLISSLIIFGEWKVGFLGYFALCFFLTSFIQNQGQLSMQKQQHNIFMRDKSILICMLTTQVSTIEGTNGSRNNLPYMIPRTIFLESNKNLFIFITIKCRRLTQFRGRGKMALRLFLSIANMEQTLPFMELQL